MGGGDSYYGVQKKVRVLFRGLIEIYLSCCNLFLQFLYYREEINDFYLCTVVCMLYCGDALERSNNPYIESIMEPCVSKNQKEIFVMWV